MSFDVCVCYGPKDSELGSMLGEALAAADFTTTTPGQGSAPDPARLGVPELDFGGARLAIVLVTRNWTAAGGLGSVLALAERTETRPLLVWWDEDAPSDFAGNRRPDENILYACFMEKGERVPAIVARAREILAA